ncbi:tetratricopeptide repeat protein 22-like [Diadema antillarum]
MDEQKKAEEKFDEVLQLDRNNINATGNLVVLYKRQSRMRFFRECLEKLKKLLADRNPLYLARAYADRAHAIRHFEQDVRCFSYTAFIKKAVEIGAETDSKEKAEWLFDYGLALYRRDSQLVMGQAASSVTEASFREAAAHFALVTEISEAPSEYRALSWIFMGILLRTKPSRTLGQALPDSIYLNSYTPQDCFEQALSIRSDHPIVLRRVASELTLLKQYDRAKKLFEQSLDLEPSWFANRHKGLLCLAMAEDCSLSVDDTERRELLVSAKKQFEIALEFKQVHADHSDLGYVHFLLGDHNSAVQEYSLAVRCRQDDNFNVALTHLRWGQCLQDMGEKEGAQLQYAQEKDVNKKLRKQANVLEAAFTHSHGTNCCGFECDLSRFDYCSSERPGYINVLSEVKGSDSSYMPQFFPRDPSPFKYDFFVSFSHIDHKWTVAFVRKLERAFNVRGCIRYRDYEYGATIAENIAENIDNSYRTILIITPDSLRDHWCRYEMQRAHMETLKRRCIVPIMLRQCKLPLEVENLTHIKCRRGQFVLDDWYRIRDTLRQNTAVKTKGFLL